ncbi:prepilin peptidase [Nitrospira sp. NS4]|uniref:prepilin peptidase n=1 Tax=Nitrospira sp. NS4 TaxID=3414498 RepID=UPI003C2DBBAC
MWQLYVIAGLWGSLIGSFLNVCIYRLPRRESIAWPGSHCPACGHPIAWYDNIPLIGYLVLRGRCRTCAVSIPIQYPVVEALNALGYLALLWFFGPGWEAIVYAGLFSALLVVAGTDLTHKIIPNAVTFPGIVLGLVSAGTVLPLGLLNGVIGLLVGGGILWVLAWASPYLFGKEGMGGGDIKLLAMIGAFLGWKPAVLTIMIGSFVGSVIGVSLLAAKIIRREDYIPFGPFLVFGAILSLFYGSALIDWYQGLLAG